MEPGAGRPLVVPAVAVVVAVTLLLAITPARSVANASAPPPTPAPVVVDPITVVARGSVPVVAAARPEVVAFATDARLPGDRRGVRDIYVRDGSSLARVSRALRGFEAGSADQPAISADGNVVVFRMMLRPRRTGSDVDVPLTPWIVVNDRRTGTSRRLVPTPYLDQQQPAISPDGRVVGFVARRQPGEALQVLAVDRASGMVSLVSANAGRPGDGPSREPAVSHGGRVIAFTTEATDLLPGAPDINGAPDVYVARDTIASPANPLLRITDALPGQQSDGPSSSPSVSDDGRVVAFQSSATNLVPGDTNATTDVFVRDLASGAATMVSTGPTSVAGNGPSRDPAISADGRYVAFTSAAGNLLPVAAGRRPLRPAPTPTNFALLDAEGRRWYGSAATASGMTVRVAFPQSAIDRAVGATVAEGAVIDGQVLPAATRHGRSNANPVGTVGGGPAAAGGGPTQLPATSAPDLVSADYRRDTGFVTFTFDVPVRDIHLSPSEVRFADGPASQVYARDLARQRTVVVTTPTATGGRASGAGSASISRDGRLVAFASGAPARRVATADLLVATTDPPFLRFEPDDLLRTVVVTNDGFGRLRPGIAELTGPSAGDYRISSNTCQGGLYSPAQSCFVVVALQPGRSGPRHATLLVSDGASGSPRAVELSAGSLVTRASHCVPTAGSIPCTPEPDVEIDPCGPPPPVLQPQAPTTTNYSTSGGISLVVGPSSVSAARVPENPCPTTTTSTSTSTTSTSTSTTTTSTSTTTTTTSTTTTTTTTTPTTLPPTTTTTTTTLPPPELPPPDPLPPPEPPPPEPPRPRLVLNPPLGEPGKVTMAIGTGYPPNTDVLLTWDRGLGQKVARSDGSGRFKVPVLIFHRDRLGPRVMTGAAPGASATAPFLAVPGSLIPGDFVIRR